MSKLLHAIETNNIEDIQKFLKANITVNPNDSENSMKTALKKIEQKNLPIWEQHDDATFNTNRTEWTQDYFVELQVDLRMNFSKERFMHMLEVGKVAFPVLIEEKQTQQKVTIKQNQETDNDGTSEKKNRTLLAGLVGVAVIVLVAVLIKMIKND
ncbi:hypothetical protein [Lysinibacillus sp. IITD104]|uniref:hypothetical protein n=1 Tax=Lysinibacillus sp. IITD104 TaxID=3116650 RepID=UPI002FCEE338